MLLIKDAWLLSEVFLSLITSSWRSLGGVMLGEPPGSAAPLFRSINRRGGEKLQPQGNRFAGRILHSQVCQRASVPRTLDKTVDFLFCHDL